MLQLYLHSRSFPSACFEWHRSLPDHHRAEGTLLEDGRLQYKGKTYDSPASFTKATGVTSKHNAYHVLYLPDGTPIQSFRGGANKCPVPLGQTVKQKKAPQKRARAPSASSSLVNGEELRERLQLSLIHI